MWWLLAGAAWGWEPEAIRATSAPTDAVAAAVGWRAAATRVAFTGPSGTVVDGAKVGPPGVALRWEDLDRDGEDELLVCGPGGVVALRGALAIPLTKAACEALAVVQVGDARSLVTAAGGVVTRWASGPAGLRPEVLDVRTTGPVRLADDGPRLAIADGSPSVRIIGPEGTSTLATRAPVTALVAGPRSFTWLSDGAVEDATRRALPAPEAAGILADAEHVWVWGPAGLSVDGASVAAPFGAALAALGDADGDGTSDVLLADPATGRAALLLGSDAAPPAVPVADPATPSAVVPASTPGGTGPGRVGPPGAQTPVRARQGVRDSVIGVRACYLGFGASVAGVVPRGDLWIDVGAADVALDASPALAFACRFAKGPVHWFAGVDTAPWMVLRPDLGHALLGTIGVEYGRERWGVGAFATGGFLMAGFGARAFYAFPSERIPSGPELRLTVFPDGTGAEVLALYSVTLQRRRDR